MNKSCASQSILILKLLTDEIEALVEVDVVGTVKDCDNRTLGSKNLLCCFQPFRHSQDFSLQVRQEVLNLFQS